MKRKRYIMEIEIKILRKKEIELEKKWRVGIVFGE